MLKDFRKFILRGNIVDLAVAVIIGAAFSAIVTALVKDLVTPLVAALFGKPSFEKLYITWNHSIFMYGDFLSSVVSFLLVAAVLFFLVIQPINKINALANRNKKPEDPTKKKCPRCLSIIPTAASRCAFCTSELS